MNIAVDTNIVIDIFTKRDPWFDDSYKSLKAILSDEESHCLISASAVTDIFYILRKYLGKEKAKAVIEQLSHIAELADVQSSDIQAALESPLSDFEDAVLDATAKRHGADLILTRNTRDFENSSVQAVCPADFLNQKK